MEDDTAYIIHAAFLLIFIINTGHSCPFLIAFGFAWVEPFQSIYQFDPLL